MKERAYSVFFVMSIVTTALTAFLLFCLADSNAGFAVFNFPLGILASVYCKDADTLHTVVSTCVTSMSLQCQMIGNVQHDCVMEGMRLNPNIVAGRRRVSVQLPSTTIADKYDRAALPSFPLIDHSDESDEFI